MKSLLTILLCILLPILCFAGVTRDSNIQFKHDLLSIVNYVLVIVSLISIRQFFWPGDNNRTTFQIFNMIFTVVYYIISLTFLINHKEYYEGFENLSNLGVIRKFFFDFDLSMVLQFIVAFSFVINILYIRKHGKHHYLDIV